VITHPTLSVLALAGVKLGLDRVKGFLTAIDEPQLNYPVIHVGGTNGKGSVCTMVSRALVAAGYRTGTNLSPHLEHVNERVQIDLTPIDDASFSDAVEHLDRAVRDWKEANGLSGTVLTYFEFVTCLAFLVFAQRQVQAAVIEVGMGGRLDATNVVKPVVSAITSIGFDHVEELGETLALIAGEKAGIIKPKTPVVIGVLPREAQEVIIARAKALGAPLWRPGGELRKEKRGEVWALATPDGMLKDVRLGMKGDHQSSNALVALGILHQLRRAGFAIPDEAIRAGLEKGVIAGRMETLAPGLLADGAHNIDGTTALAAFLQSRPRPPSRLLLFGMGYGRDPVAILKPLIPHFDEIVVTRCAHPKAWDPRELTAVLAEHVPVLSNGGDIEQALPEVYREAHETVVAGSLYLVGAARALVAEGALAGIEPGQGPAPDEDDGEEGYEDDEFDEDPDGEE
jgi:dihydrofolate synthase/folylpolyglutamate synthase